MRKEKLKTLLESRMNSTAFNDIFSKEEQQEVINTITNHTKKFLNHQIVVRPSLFSDKVWTVEDLKHGRLFVQVPVKKWDNFQDMVSRKYHLCKGSIGLKKAYSLEINSDDFMTITNENYV